ncbi:MAG: hypothetical protein LC104_12385 [Bacteroidales bacterium]|nr:hypothetical protein [Bacteroidales bacterium]
MANRNLRNQSTPTTPLQQLDSLVTLAAAGIADLTAAQKQTLGQLWPLG